MASPYGVNAHAPQGPDLARLFDQLQAADVGWVRIDFEWIGIEPQPGVFHWQVYDAIVAAAELRGLAVLGILAYTPAWATDGNPRSGVPRQIADWEDFCFRAATRYRGRVQAWELWNEPNLDKFFAGSPSQYIDRILVPGAHALRAADPAALVGGPGLAHLTSGDSDWYNWLLEVLERAGDELDFVSHHLYDRDGHRDVSEKLNDSTTFGDEPQLWDASPPSVREVLEEGGWQGPFYLTETGWASDQVGEQRQADYYRGFLEEWLSGRPDRDWIDKVFFYELRDDPSQGIPKWGVLRADRGPKPAFAAYRDFIAAHPAPDGAELALLGSRFAVKARWRRPDGASGAAAPVPFSDQTGLFWFFQPANIELLVKILDGRPVNGHFWVLFGALSNVEYWVDVTDRTTGQTRTYHNPAGTYCGQADTASLPAAAHSLGAAPLTPVNCVPGPNVLCLETLGRFRAEAEFRDPRTGLIGPAKAVQGTGTSGYFWFFRPENLELVIKVLDGQATNGHYWFFWGALSNVEYWINLTDTFTGEKRRYHNRPGSFCGGNDIQAF